MSDRSAYNDAVAANKRHLEALRRGEWKKPLDLRKMLAEAAANTAKQQEGLMAESATSLSRRGLISTKAMNATLAKTKVQKSKMADFDGKSKDEGEKNSRGAKLGKNGHINSADTQRDRAKSTPSKGARVNASYVPGRQAIDQFPRGQGRTFPAGGKVSAKNAGKNTRMKGPIAKQGGQYGGPSSRAAG